MTLPSKPPAWANKISIVLQEFQKLTGNSLYPVRVQDIATDLSKQFFPSAPITKITGEEFSEGFEGVLKRVPNTKDDWGIIYNTAIRSPGRINFTLAHELGHYLLHRMALEGGIIQCSRKDMLSWDSEHAQREVEANEFASYLLMPRNLFEEFIRGQNITLHLLQQVADHFNVSLTAATLKWLQFTPKRAMLVVGKDGFVYWAKASNPLFKSGVYLRTKNNVIELPSQSLAIKKDSLTDNESGVMHKAGVWPFNEDVREMTVNADTYDMTITLLLFSDEASGRMIQPDDGDELMDTYDKFQLRQQRQW